MPRAPRIHYPGAVYHVMARGVDGRAIFVDDDDRHAFITVIRRVRSESAFTLIAYCLMGNHFHFAIRSEGAPISVVMHRLLTTYVIGFNRRHEREGHLFQARFKSVLCLDDRYLIALVRYIHQNPVRAGITSTPGDWPWSSHREFSTRRPDSLTNSDLFYAAAAAYEPAALAFDRWSLEQSRTFRPWPDEPPPKSVERTPLSRERSISQIAQDLFTDDPFELRSGSRRHSLTAKKVVLANAAIRCGHSLTDIANWMSCTPQAVHRLLHLNN